MTSRFSFTSKSPLKQEKEDHLPQSPQQKNILSNIGARKSIAHCQSRATPATLRLTSHCPNTPRRARGSRCAPCRNSPAGFCSGSNQSLLVSTLDILKISNPVLIHNTIIRWARISTNICGKHCRMMRAYTWGQRQVWRSTSIVTHATVTVLTKVMSLALFRSFERGSCDKLWLDSINDMTDEENYAADTHSTKPLKLNSHNKEKNMKNDIKMGARRLGEVSASDTDVQSQYNNTRRTNIVFLFAPKELQLTGPSVFFKAGCLNLWVTDEFLMGHGLVLLKLSTFCKLNLFIENLR